MTKLAYVVCMAFLAILAESFLASLGIVIPALALTVFHLTVAFGPYSGAASAILGGASLDFVLGRPHPLSVALLLVVVALAMLWLYKIDTGSLILSLIPGSAIPFIAWLPHALLGISSASGAILMLSYVLSASLVSAFLLPSMILMLDSISQALKLELYTDARQHMARAK